MMKRQREDVLVRRSVCVERIPDGSPIDLEAGTLAQITQALGSSFTLVVEGQLVRLRGADADAIGKKEPAARALPAVVEAKDVSDLVWQTLRTCYDPEIPVNIVELGLIYRCVLEPLEDTEKVRVVIDMTLTAPGCGMGEILVADVSDKLKMIPTISEADVELVFDPPWGRSMMSELAKLETGML